MAKLLYIIKYVLRSYSSSAVGKLEYSYAILFGKNASAGLHHCL